MMFRDIIHKSHICLCMSRRQLTTLGDTLNSHMRCIVSIIIMTNLELLEDCQNIISPGKEEKTKHCMHIENDNITHLRQHYKFSKLKYQ